MFGIGEDLDHLAGFHQIPSVHDGDMRTDRLDDGHFMGDQDDRDAEFTVEVLQQGKDLLGGLRIQGVASSQSRTSGSLANARAIATRCFCPPLSWEG